MSESDADGWTPLHFAAEVSQVHPCLQSTSLYIPFPPRKKEVGFMHSDLNALACIPEGLIWGMLCPATKCGPGHSLIVRPTPYLLPEAVRKGGVHFYHPNTHNVRAPSLPLFCAHHRRSSSLGFFPSLYDYFLCCQGNYGRIVALLVRVGHPVSIANKVWEQPQVAAVLSATPALRSKCLVLYD